MDAKKLEYFDKVLSKERVRVAADLLILEKENKEAAESGEVSGDDNFEDQIGDSASITFERELDFSLENNMRDILAQIDIALGRIHSKKFGNCDSCGKIIDEARLKALPYTDLCIECKIKQEKGQI